MIPRVNTLFLKWQAVAGGEAVRRTVLQCIQPSNGTDRVHLMYVAVRGFWPASPMLHQMFAV
jgi:hypothetical protein